MFKLFGFIVFLLPMIAFGQASQRSITAIDFVKVKNNKYAEAIYYYENNWKVYREIALRKDYIASFKLLKAVPDSVSNFDFILITEYRDSLQLKLSEERFARIIKEIRPDGAQLLNDVKPNDFRENVLFKQTQTLFSGRKE